MKCWLVNWFVNHHWVQSFRLPMGFFLYSIQWWIRHLRKGSGKWGNNMYQIKISDLMVFRGPARWDTFKLCGNYETKNHLNLFDKGKNEWHSTLSFSNLHLWCDTHQFFEGITLRNVLIWRKKIMINHFSSPLKPVANIQHVTNELIFIFTFCHFSFPISASKWSMSIGKICVWKWGNYSIWHSNSKAWTIHIMRLDAFHQS